MCALLACIPLLNIVSVLVVVPILGIHDYPVINFFCVASLFNCFVINLIFFNFLTSQKNFISQTSKIN
ncbi:MAG: hypothetical protein RL262_1740 [Bacteroidota bacterium]